MTRSDRDRDPPVPARRLSRRQALRGSLAVAGAVALAAPGGVAAAAPSASQTAAQQEPPPPDPPSRTPGPPPPGPAPDDGTISLFGEHQAGIATAAQERLVFAAFDLKVDGLDALRGLLRSWTDAAEAMTQGQPVPGNVGGALAPPIDTGEAAGLGPSHLTMTFGFGPALFDDRFGLADRRPEALVDLPPFPGDRLVPALCGGDLCVQACADDPQVAFHAVRNLARISRGMATIRWLQLGFGRTSTTSLKQATPRNLMGFKDGTNNLRGEDVAALDEHVWVGADADQPWMRGGSYLVSRRIRMRIESWDRASLREQEQIIGRRKTTGAPLTGQREMDPVDLDALAPDGAPAIPQTAHIRVAAPALHGGARILRRGYSFTDGIDPSTGELDAGLFFICYQRDPRVGFISLQQQLSASDALNEYIRHTGSAMFACPGGIQAGDFIGSALVSDSG
jgi:deferrochelatase/peroxidase EfeB